MNKFMVAIAALVFLAGIVISYDYFSTDKSPSTVESSNQSEPMDSQIPDDGKSISLSRYLDYSESLVKNTAGVKLLFFHAPWCSQCKKIEESIIEKGLPEDITVFKVDYDSNQDLRKLYDVTIQTTFVKIGDSGEKIDSYVAYEKPDFASVERALLR